MVTPKPARSAEPPTRDDQPLRRYFLRRPAVAFAKIAEGKTHKEALRSLKRRISNAIYARLLADVRQAAAASATGPGGQPGNDSVSSAAGSHPRHR